MAMIDVKEIADLTPRLLKIPYDRIWSSYDKEVDVLYLNFKKPSNADISGGSDPF
jgi:hypothetical protein